MHDARRLKMVSRVLGIGAVTLLATSGLASLRSTDDAQDCSSGASSAEASPVAFEGPPGRRDQSDPACTGSNNLVYWSLLGGLGLGAAGFVTAVVNRAPIEPLLDEDADGEG